jgi:Zn-finger nucleic acid-binding protein
MTDRELLCPRSSFRLSRLRVGGIDTDVCEDCGGLWLDRIERPRFEDPGNVFGDALVAHLRQFPPTLLDHSIRLSCPRHPAVMMMRRRFSMMSSVEIDECPECGGIWLDADELAQIRR